MASQPRNNAKFANTTIEHFTHPWHRLAEYIDEQEGYLCDGCKTPGIGKRYRCHGCNFDLHEYCGTCPRNLSISFMHQHPLSLVVRKAQSTRQNDRVCNVCQDSVEGLFYRCKACDFDLHPICTQLPETLNHVLHQVHPLKLEAPPSSSLCAICKGVCSSWRYRCGLCSFDMHLQCLLVSCEKTSHSTTHRGRPSFVPPHAAHPCYEQYPSSSFPSYGFQFPPQPQHVHGGAAYAHPCYEQYPASSFPSHGFQFPTQPQHVHGGAAYANGVPLSPMPYPMHYHGYAPQAGSAAPVTGGIGNIMFRLVKQLAFGVVSNLVFGVDFSSFL